MSEPYDPAGADSHGHEYAAAGTAGAGTATLPHDATSGDTLTAPAPPPAREASPWTVAPPGDDRGAPPPPPPPPTATAEGGGSGWGPWGPGAWAPPPPRTPGTHTLAGLVLGVLALALVAAGAGIGFSLARQNATTAPSAAGSVSPGGSGSSASSGAASQIASKVEPAVVDVNTQLGYQGGSAAGTGIVLTSSGEILTNNHVIEGATRIQVTDVGNGRTYAATVVGTDATDDIAVLKLQNASGLATVSLGDSSTVSVGDAVVAMGNAGGTGGTPSVSAGQVVALNQSITASDQGAGTTEQLHGLIQTSATLQPGDSGGPLVDSHGDVIGIDSAASGGFQFQSGSNANFAIPINQARSIAKQIESGHGSATVHIGPAAFLGVEVQSAGGSGTTGTGAAIVGVEAGTPADRAGLAAGDVIESLDGRSVDSPDTLSSIMGAHHPGDTVQLGWTDSSGQQHNASVQLASGPPA